MSILIVIAAILGVANLGLLIVLVVRPRAAGLARDDLDRLERNLREDLVTARTDQSNQAKGLRDEVGGNLQRVVETLEARLETVRATVEQRLTKLSEGNEAKLEAMRQTVDEKLQTTLDKRLTESFGLVSERLEKVRESLGEMQSLASGVGDLKRVLTNVKTRGTWGEVQLGNLLEQMFAPEQYEHNFAPRPGSPERVEYAVRYPGAGEGALWLPIDAKFPAEDYERLVLAAERADAAAVEEAGKALENRVRGFAKEVAEKYIAPPRTTDHAILFLPTEGLYAELLRRPGLAEALQRDYRVILCGPTTLAAILNGILFGFRRIAIAQHTREIQDLLAVVKSEFGKFGDTLDKVRNRLAQAVGGIDEIDKRKRVMLGKLKDVESLPAPGTQGLLALAIDAAPDESDGADDGE